MVNEELLKPLHIAETIGAARYFDDLLNAPSIEKGDVIALLKQLEQTFGLTFFVASEKQRKQYLSNGREINLIEGEVFWYFEAMQQERDLFADLGQVGDVHLYFDMKVYNHIGEYLGIVGVGKSLKVFLERFSKNKQLYGYDFLFVNDDNEIIVTSIADLVVTDAHIPSLSSLDWYQKLGSDNKELNGRLISKDGEDFLISEISIEELDWKLLLLTPLQERQSQITKSFVNNTVIAISLVLIFFALMFWIMLYYKHHLERTADIDPLSQLPNRASVHRRYRQLQRMRADVSIIIVDIDHFKAINDNYGHNTGDSVIKEVSKILSEEIREQDLVGRWGGEEFIILVPTDSDKVAEQISNRARIHLENTLFTEQGLKVTASFGLTHGNSKVNLSDLVAFADAAMYEAKRSGRNKVIFRASEYIHNCLRMSNLIGKRGIEWLI